MLSQIRNLGLKLNFNFNKLRTITSLDTIDKLNIYHFGKKTKKNNQLKNITNIYKRMIFPKIEYIYYFFYFTP